jgi:DNA repair protein RadC
MTYELRIVNVGGVHEPVSDIKVTHPEDALSFLSCIRDQDTENFVVLTLNSAGRVITSRIVTTGLLNHSLVHPRETFRGAILDNAAMIIIAHNHPSGSLEPSSQDITITRQIKEAGVIIGISLQDHIIVAKGTDAYTSMRERGLM